MEKDLCHVDELLLTWNVEKWSIIDDQIYVLEWSENVIT